MNKKLIAIALIVMVMFVLTACAIDTEQEDAAEAAAPAENRIVVEIGDNVVKTNTLTVSGTGSVSVMPDVAYVTVGVMTQDRDMKDAQSDNKDIMNALFDALKAAGLTEDDMRTTNYSAYPTYDYNNGKSTITGYQITNTVQLTVGDIDRVGEFLDIAAENGANTSFSIRFSLLDENAYYNQALADAMTNAKGKADAITQAGGHVIVATVSINEGGSYYVPRMEYAMDETADMGGKTPITTDELEVNATVTVVYEIK